MHELIGLRVMHRTTKRRGRIKNIIDRKMVVSFAEGEAAYPFPACLVDTFIIEDEEMQKRYTQEGDNASFM